MIWLIIYLLGVIFCFIFSRIVSSNYLKRRNLKSTHKHDWIGDFIISLFSWYGVLVLFFGILGGMNELDRD